MNCFHFRIVIAKQLIVKNKITWGFFFCIHTIYIIVYISPLQFGGGAGTPDSVEGPNVRYPVATLLNQSLLSRVGIYLLQNQEPSTPLISDKKNHVFYKIKDLTCEGIKKNHLLSKNLKVDSVEICVRVDSVEIFGGSLIL